MQQLIIDDYLSPELRSLIVDLDCERSSLRQQITELQEQVAGIYALLALEGAENSAN
jgi:hypothetical protein